VTASYSANTGTKTKTINISFVSASSSKELCEEVIGKTLDKSKDELLWIMAAGNLGYNNLNSQLSQEKTIRCPQGAVEKPDGTIRSNALIVTSKARHGGYFDHGNEYADIEAHGYDGTSFASPAVAKVAAKIAMKYENLKPKDIANAILMGAEIERRENTINPNQYSRTGGFLNEHRAIKIAEYLSQKWE